MDMKKQAVEESKEEETFRIKKNLEVSEDEASYNVILKGTTI